MPLQSIPPVYVVHIRFIFSDIMMLYNYPGERWGVNIERDDDMFYFFGDGWCAFCDDNGVEITMSYIRTTHEQAFLWS